MFGVRHTYTHAYIHIHTHTHLAHIYKCSVGLAESFEVIVREGEDEGLVKYRESDRLVLVF